ncbi:PREDICTED: uncharacterized protein LOC107115685 [Gekko japonicus]|uniref:Uncharacterized protein LOC107115685 n=1 Tax=Gekko japonicus TaxID=146911 RepID=A0ABM1KGU3_GEKJA|nr:PREDICTED: uncharacterized protein LOC107115685 [Gekko japonicus]
MARILALSLLSVLLSQAFCLQCNTCQGEYDCVGETVTCKDPWASCTTSVRKASVSFMDFQTVKKGCARQLYPHQSISLNSHMMSLSYQSRFCSEDGCNNETYFVSHPPPANHMRCHTCGTQGAWCPEGARSQISCVGDQDQCVNLDVTGHMDLHLQRQATNGLECYSCADGDGSQSGCSNKTISTVQCTGIHNMCLEGTGKSRKGNKDLGIMTFKGCASEAMCQSSLLALVQELDEAEVMCCQGNLCNTRIVNGIVTESRVAADSPDLSEDEECIDSATTSPSGHTTSHEAGIAPAPPGVAPSPGSHGNNETSAVVHDDILADNWTGHENETTVDEHESHDDLFTGYSEVETAPPPGATASGHVATGGSSAATNLDKNDSGAGNTSSSNHGSVVVLVPVIVPKRNTTAATTTTTSSSSEVTNTKEVLGTANDDEAECEEEEKGISTGEHFIASEEHGTASIQSPEDTVVLGGDHASAAVFTAEGHGSTHSPATGTAGSTNVDNSHIVHSHGATEEHAPSPGHPGAGRHGATGSENFEAGGSTPPANNSLPVPYVISKENNTFVTGSGNPSVTAANAPAGTSSHDREVPVSGGGVGTSHPKKKIPCKRPSSQRQPDLNLMSSPEAEKQVMGGSISRNDAGHQERNVPGKTHFPDKTNTYSGAFGLAANLGLFSLTLFLATLLH